MHLDPGKSWSYRGGEATCPGVPSFRLRPPTSPPPLRPRSSARRPGARRPRRPRRSHPSCPRQRALLPCSHLPIRSPPPRPRSSPLYPWPPARPTRFPSPSRPSYLGVTAHQYHSGEASCPGVSASRHRDCPPAPLPPPHHRDRPPAARHLSVRHPHGPRRSRPYCHHQRFPSSCSHRPTL